MKTTTQRYAIGDLFIRRGYTLDDPQCGLAMLCQVGHGIIKMVCLASGNRLSDDESCVLNTNKGGVKHYEITLAQLRRAAGSYNYVPVPLMLSELELAVWLVRHGRQGRHP